jgi:hypothetical protein
MEHAVGAAISYEADLDRVVLRRCQPCFDNGVITPHPLATGHPDGQCPTCGAPTVAGEPLPTIKADVDQDAARRLMS